MKLSELQFAPEHELPRHSVLFRIQRRVSRPGTAAFGVVRVAPRGNQSGRFSLVDCEVGYFAEAGETAAYEALARRESEARVSLATLPNRVLLTLTVVRPVRLLDLRPHASVWPVLQSERYAETQELAAGGCNNGFEGIIFRSAQQHGADCYALFGDSMKALRLVLKEPLALSDGILHKAVITALRGSKVRVDPMVRPPSAK